MMGKYGKDYSEECRRRKEPLVADEEREFPQTAVDRIKEIGEEAYEDGVFHWLETSDLEPEDRRRDCPWKCMEGDPQCVCMAPRNRTGG